MDYDLSRLPILERIITDRLEMRTSTSSTRHPAHSELFCATAPVRRPRRSERRMLFASTGMSRRDVQEVSKLAAYLSTR